MVPEPQGEPRDGSRKQAECGDVACDKVYQQTEQADRANFLVRSAGGDEALASFPNEAFIRRAMGAASRLHPAGVVVADRATNPEPPCSDRPGCRCWPLGAVPRADVDSDWGPWVQVQFEFNVSVTAEADSGMSTVFGFVRKRVALQRGLCRSEDG